MSSTLFSPNIQDHTIHDKKPVFVLLHGLLGMAENLQRVAQFLETIGIPILYDLPNHGRSPVLAECTFIHMARLLHETLVRDVFPYAPTVHMIGHSLGGKLAAVYALLYPQTVQSIAVLDIALVEYPPWHKAEIDVLMEVNTKIQSGAITLPKEAQELISQSISDTAMRGFLMKNIYKNDAGIVAMYPKIKHIHNYYDVLRSFPQQEMGSTYYTEPTLFIQGTQSHYIQPEYYSAIEQFFPAWELEEVDAGHVIHAEKPQEVCSLLESFYSYIASI